MSHFLARLTCFAKERESFADGHGVVTTEDRTWGRLPQADGASGEEADVTAGARLPVA